MVTTPLRGPLSVYADIPIALVHRILSDPLQGAKGSPISPSFQPQSTLVSTKILLVDDRPEQLESLAALLGLYFIPIVANDDSPVHSALRLWNEDPTLRLAIVDLKMPNEAGEETLETGFELIQELRKRPGSIVVVHSGFSDPALQQRAKELGCSGFFPKDSDPEKLIERLQALAVAQIDWLATKPPSLPATNSATESLDAINSVAEARHITDRAWFLSNPALWPERQQQVVSVFDQTILGQGVDFGTAYEAARKQCAALSKPCPNQYDLTFVVVPDVVEPDPAPDWNPLKSTLS